MRRLVRPLALLGLCCAACTAPPAAPGAAPAAASEPAAAWRFGIAAFGAVEPLAQAEWLAACGYDYLEPALSRLAALPPAELAAARAQLDRAGSRVEACNWLLPRDLPVAGPAVDRGAVQAYLDRALPLAASLGARVVVFGSPASRTVPDGFPAPVWQAQLVEFLRTAAAVIERDRLDLAIGIEPLRRAETNTIHTIAEALALARAVDRPQVQLTIDLYHLASEGEDPAVLGAAAGRIAHVQLAAPQGRGFPRAAAPDPRYAPFFAALRQAGYRGRISVEAESADLAADAPAALHFLREAAGRQPPRVTAFAHGDAVHVTDRGEPFASVHTAAAPRPFVHPVLAPGGVPLTRGYPMAPQDGEERDHPHHTSLWFAHGAVGGGDFWHGTKRRERLVRQGPPQLLPTADGIAVVCDYDWVLDAATAVARERRVLAFAAAADGRSRQIDAQFALRPAAATPLLFGDTKEGSFAVRVHAALRAHEPAHADRLRDAAGRRGAAVWGQRAPWLAARGEVAGQPVALLLFDHPDNPRAPTFWHARTYGLLAANPFGVHDFTGAPAGSGDLTVPPGGELRLRYGVWLGRGDWPDDAVAAAYRAFAASPPPLPARSGTANPGR